MIAYQVYELDKFRREMWAMKPNPVDTTQQGKPVSEMTLAQLAKRHLMGSPYAESAKPVTQGPIADTKLKLELVGTIRGGSDEKDSAFIRAQGKESKRYYVGEQIEGGALLDAVNEDAITLKRGGSLEILRYAKDQSAAPAPQVKTNNVPVKPVSAPVKSAATPQDIDTSKNDKPQAPLSLRERLKRKAQGANPQDNP